MSEQSYTVEEFCKAERISRGMHYLQWRRGKGPRFYFSDNHRRITSEARAEYHQQREAEAPAEAAKSAAKYAERATKRKRTARAVEVAHG